MSERFLLIFSASVGTDQTTEWLCELATAYWFFADAGIGVDFRSPSRVSVTCWATLDTASLPPAARRLMSDARARTMLTAGLRLSDAIVDDYAGLYLIGGTGAGWDLVQDASVKRLVEGFGAADKIIAGNGQGVLGLTRAVDRDGHPLARDRRMTGMTAAEAWSGPHAPPVIAEAILRKLGARYSSAPASCPHVVIDPPFFTGQNSASAKQLARDILSHLDAQRGRVETRPSLQRAARDVHDR